jgi:hypothetical protein
VIYPTQIIIEQLYCYSPVLSKIFELCILHKFGSFFYSHDLQLGFKKGVGCVPAVFAVQETVKHFTDRDSRPTVYAAALDATKAFDSVNHGLLFRKLKDRNVPPCLINTLACYIGVISGGTGGPVPPPQFWSGGTVPSTFYCPKSQPKFLSPPLFKPKLRHWPVDIANCMQLLDGMLHSVKIFRYVVELDKVASCLLFYSMCMLTI